MAQPKSAFETQATREVAAAGTPDEALPPATAPLSENPREISSYRFATLWGAEKNPDLAAFSAWTQEYLSASPTERLTLEEKGVALAETRRAVFKDLIQTHPKAALAQTPPVTVRQQLPLRVVELLEKRVTGKGDFQVLGRTDANATPAIARRAVIDGTIYDAFTYGERLKQRTAQNISLHGVELDGSLALSESPLRVLEEGEPIPANKPLAADSCVVSKEKTAPTKDGPRSGAVAAESGDRIFWLCRGGHITAAAEGVAADEGSTARDENTTTGPQSVLVILVEFPDLVTAPTTRSIALSTLNTVTTFIQENACGQISFPTKVVTPPLKVERASVTYATSSNGDTLLLADARAAARAAGYDPDHYDYDVAAFAHIGFPWGGQGYVGAKGAWVQGSFPAGTTAHELGHNLGVWHANSWQGDNSAVDVSGIHNEYGNIFDVMGRSSNFPEAHYNSTFKYLLGWLPEPNIHTATNSGAYRIYAHDQNSLLPNRKYALRIPAGLSAGGELEDYWIDFRQLLAARYPATAAGAIVQWGNDWGGPSASRLLDATYLTDTMSDAPLPLHQTLRDVDQGFEITPIASGGTGSDAYMDVQIAMTPKVVITVAEAVDTPALIWSNSVPGWSGQRSVTHDGTDAAFSGVTEHNGENFIETTVLGPGAITFWWKVSCEADFDYLQLLDGATELARISGEVGWGRRSYEVGPGFHVLRWVYKKDDSASAGFDRAWLDQVSFNTSARPPTINFQPQAALAGVGEKVEFQVDAGGTAPLSYQWRLTIGAQTANIQHGTNATLTLNNVQLTDAGFYSVEVSNALGTATSATALLTVIRTMPLTEAVDYAGAAFATSGSVPWRGQFELSHDGIDAAQSGAVAHDRESSLTTTLVGPGELSFWWKVSSEADFDVLGLYLDGALVEQHSGEFGWARKSVTIPNGTHQVRWTYAKDANVSQGADAGWVDEVRFDASTGIAPTIVAQPVSQAVSVGGTALFTIGYIGSNPVGFQWFKNNLPIAGANGLSLLVTNAVLADAGIYTAQITNFFGAAVTAPAELSFVPISVGDAVEQPLRAWLPGGSGPWEARSAVTHDGVDAAASAAIGDDSATWMETTVQGPAEIAFWWKVSSEANYDLLTFEVNGSVSNTISGSVGWTRTTAALPPGQHTLRWKYAKDSNSRAGEDRAWVDQFEINDLAPAAPRISMPTLQANSLAAVIQALSEPGRVVLEVSTNLTTWTPVLTNTVSAATMPLHRPVTNRLEYMRIRVER